MDEVRLKRWELSDAASIQEQANNPLVAKWLRDLFPRPYSLADAEAFIRSCIDQEGKSGCWRAIMVNGAAVGSISIAFGTDIAKKSAELGYFLGEPFWGQGIMTKAVQLICKEAFATYDMIRIYAMPFADNRPSRRVLEKAGFQLEGIMRESVFKDGIIHDSCIYALLKKEMA